MSTEYIESGASNFIAPRVTRRVALISLATLAAPAQSQQSSFPTKPLTLTVPFASGGGTDTVARMIGVRLGSLLGQPVIVEHRLGANGLIASRYVAKQSADGYSILLGSNSTHVIAPLTAKTQADDIKSTQADFEVLSIVANAPLVLAVRSASVDKDVPAFIRHAKQQRLTFATFGIGSSAHLMGEILGDSAHINLLHVPYKGSAPAITDLIGGHIDSVFLTVAAIKGMVDAGSVRALAVTGRARVPTLPHVPTFEELGIKDMANAGWFAVFAPSRMPPAISERLSSALRVVANEQEVRAKLIELGLDPVGSTQKEANATWSRTISMAEPIVKRAKIELQ